MVNCQLLFFIFALTGTVCAVSFAKSAEVYEKKVDFERLLFGRSLDKIHEVKEPQTEKNEDQVKNSDVKEEESEVQFKTSDGNRSGKRRTNNSDRDSGHHHENTVIVVPPKPPYNDWVPQCYGKNEVWSTSVKCDVRCDFEGDDDYSGYPGDDFYGDGTGNFPYGGYARAANSYCFRTVSDVLFEEGDENVVTRESLGFPPEPKDEYEARTIDVTAVEMLRRSMTVGNFISEVEARNWGSSHHNDQEYVVVTQPRPPNRRPPGRCVCRAGFARLNGKCVRFGYCPLAECRKPEYYLPCGPTCEPNCRTDLSTFVSTCAGCKRGCFCPHGLVRNTRGNCVPTTSCTVAEQGTTSTTSTSSTTAAATAPTIAPITASTTAPTTSTTRRGPPAPT